MRNTREHVRSRLGLVGTEQLSRSLEVMLGAVSIATVPPPLGEKCVRLGGTLRRPDANELPRGVLQGLIPPLVLADLVARPPEPEEEPGRSASSVGQSSSAGVEARGGREGVERERAVARLARDGARPLGESAASRPARTRELERRQVVVREQLGVSSARPERLDPLRRAPVLLGPRGARDLAVGDVAHEHVPERVLALAGDRRAALAADELLALERVQPFLDAPARSRPAIAASAPSQKIFPTTAASWSSAFSSGGARRGAPR